jgi:preprotein translocase subunit SecG
MGIIGILLLVVFVIICVLLVCIVLIQSEEGGGMGGLFGGAGSQAFGSRSGNVITRTTYILVLLFFLTSFGLAFINKAPAVRQLNPGAVQSNAEPWLDTAAQDPASQAVPVPQGEAVEAPQGAE